MGYRGGRRKCSTVMGSVKDLLRDYEIAKHDWVRSIEKSSSAFAQKHLLLSPGRTSVGESQDVRSGIRDFDAVRQLDSRVAHRKLVTGVRVKVPSRPSPTATVSLFGVTRISSVPALRITNEAAFLSHPAKLMQKRVTAEMKSFERTRIQGLRE